jgi:hypothetical protein
MLRTRARIHLHFDNFDAALADFMSCIEQAEFERADADVRSLEVELKKAEAALEHSKTKDYYKILGRSLADVWERSLQSAYTRVAFRHSEGLLGRGHPKGILSAETLPRKGYHPLVPTAMYAHPCFVSAGRRQEKVQARRRSTRRALGPSTARAI